MELIEFAWEYLVESGYHATQKRLNELGKQGWELCACSAGGEYIFKRPKMKE